jgi:signal transduction histidine kinase
VTIGISDHGQGIPEEKLPFVFEPFFLADQSRSRVTRGYGLGLHLFKRIMDLHMTELRLENNKGDKGLVVLLNISS